MHPSISQPLVPDPFSTLRFFGFAPLCPFVSSVVELFGPTAFCLHPSASDPPGGSRFVANTGPSAIRPNGDRPVDLRFSRFSGPQSNSISALFSRFYCSDGRGSQTLPPSVWCALASTQQLVASSFYCQRS